MAAVTVAGQCRERSPADVALFGQAADRFAPRFVVPSEGEALLAEALGSGAAEAHAALRTGTGEAPFRVALWRQRGGERIRLLASFAAATEAAPSEGSLPGNVVERYSAQLRTPLSAIMGFAERLRRDQPEEAGEIAGDILAASWRMLRLVDELALLAELGAEAAPLRMGEVDIARLTRRVLRLAEPMATQAGVALRHELGEGAGPSVLADETTLWSVVENLIRAAVLTTAERGEVRLACAAERGDLVLSVESRGDRRGSLAPLKMSEELSAANGARLAVADSDGFRARLTFPRERCLNPI